MPQRLFNMLNTPANKFLLRTSLPSILSLSMLSVSVSESARQLLLHPSAINKLSKVCLQDSFSTQATQALQQASKLGG